MPENPTHSRSHLTLEAVTVDCAPQMLEWVSQPELAEAIGLRKEPSLAKTVDWIENIGRDAGRLAWAIRVDGTHAGIVAFDQDVGGTAARFSIYLGAETERGKGLGTRAALLALDLAFRETAWCQVWLAVHAENAIAIQSYRRIGFRETGRTPGEFRIQGRAVDGVFMILSREEFRARKDRSK